MVDRTGWGGARSGIALEKWSKPVDGKGDPHNENGGRAEHPIQSKSESPLRDFGLLGTILADGSGIGRERGKNGAKLRLFSRSVFGNLSWEPEYLRWRFGRIGRDVKCILVHGLLAIMTEKKAHSSGVKLTPEPFSKAHPEWGFLHAVDKPDRTLPIWRKEWEFLYTLRSLADLPLGLEKLDRIDKISEKTKIREIWRRARLSRLECEFLTLISALISANEKQWIPLVKNFLKAYGWKADLRGAPKIDQEALIAFKRGPNIEKIKKSLEGGFNLKLQEKARSGYASGNDEIADKLKKLKYDDNAIRAILRGRILDTAACYYYRIVEEPAVHYPKTILNSYRKYQRMKNSSS